MVGDVIHRFRTERGMSSQGLADAIGTSLMAIEQYEANHWRPGTQTIAKIAKVLDVRVDELLEDCRLLQDDVSKEIIIVRKAGDKQVRVVGTIKDECQDLK
jgi:transcriptional regulator with XRE-family HTH domain